MTSNELLADWGPRLTRARQAKDLSIGDLARRSGLHKSHLARFERGEAGLGDDARIRVAAEVGQQVAELFPYPLINAQDASPCPPVSSAAAEAAPASSRTTDLTDGTTASNPASDPTASCATAPAASTSTATPSGGER